MKPLQWITVCLFAFGFAATVRADDEFDKLNADFEAARKAYREKRMEEKLKDPEGLEATGGAVSGVPAFLLEFHPKFKVYAAKHADKPEAVSGLVWLVTHPATQPSPDKPDPDAVEAIKMLTEKHISDPSLVKDYKRIRGAEWFVGEKPVMDFFERVSQANKDKEALASASFCIGLIHYDSASMPGMEGKKEEAESRRKLALNMFRKVARDYPGTEAAQNAEPFFFELEKLQVGMTAPDIEGDGIDGKKIKLSQFRGKVVVVDFWGFW
ncbi:MAG: hypothetical protein AABZ47_02600 [Planctomycetota bacterium]